MLKDLHGPARIVWVAIVAGFLTCVFLLLLSLSMQREVDHDEHLFVAGGKLLADTSLVPYREYHFLHMPNLALAYAVMFKFTDHSLLAGRVFSVLCAWASAVLVFYVGLKVLPHRHYLVRTLMAAGSVILLITNPFFTYTSGRAWNQEPSVLFALLAFVLHSHGARQERGRKWVLLSGASLGLAVGTRLTVAPAVLPFAILLFAFPYAGRTREKLHLLGAFSGGVLLGMSPVFVLGALAPRRVWFDTIGYHLLSAAYRQASGYRRAMSLVGKLHYMKDVMSETGNLLLVASFVYFGLGAAWGRIRGRGVREVELAFALAVIPFIMIGCLVPAPTWYQYFYAPVPFLVLGITYGIAAWCAEGERGKWRIGVGVPVILGAVMCGLPSYRDVGILLTPDEWFPSKVHAIGVSIRETAGSGKVLTLAPIYPLEGGLEIYEEFASGPFLWRVASLLPEDTRRELGVIAEPELRKMLERRPPRAVLTGFEGELERPFLEYANGEGSQKGVLVLAERIQPVTDWGGVPSLVGEGEVSAQRMAGEKP